MSQAASKYVVPRCKAWRVEGLVPSLQPHEILLVDASDYARLEQECDRLRCVAQAMQEKENNAQQSRTQLAISNANLTLERDAAIKQIRRLVEAGNPLSNTAYNLAQHEGRPLSKYDCELMSELRKRWDAALSAKP